VCVPLDAAVIPCDERRIEGEDPILATCTDSFYFCFRFFVLFPVQAPFRYISGAGSSFYFRFRHRSVLFPVQGLRSISGSDTDSFLFPVQVLPGSPPWRGARSRLPPSPPDAPRHVSRLQGHSAQLRQEGNGRFQTRPSAGKSSLFSLFMKSGENKTTPASHGLLSSAVLNGTVHSYAKRAMADFRLDPALVSTLVFCCISLTRLPHRGACKEEGALRTHSA